MVLVVVNLWYLFLPSHKVIISANLWESSGKTGGRCCIRPLFWLCLRFREVIRVDAAFVGKGESFISSPGPTDKWHVGLSSIRFSIILCWGPKLVCNPEEVALFIQTLFSNFSFMKHRAASCYALPLGHNRTALCLHLTPVFTFLPF